MNLANSVIAFVLVVTQGVHSYAATRDAKDHTGIGSGGDVMAAYLEETRNQIQKTLHAWIQDPTDRKQKICHNLGLTEIQQNDCYAFINSTAHGFLGILLGGQRVKFELSKEPLYVDGQRVAAMTLTGPEGPITFDYELIAARTPKLLMALLLHEVGHKVAFAHSSNSEERLYVQDEGALMSFASGRALLDHVGLALANYALERRIIGQAFFLRDAFHCQISVDGHSFYQSGDDIRTFLPTEDSVPFGAYESGIGGSRKTKMAVKVDDRCLSFRLLLHERKNCAAASDALVTEQDRFTKLELWESSSKDSKQTQFKIGEHHIPRWNPTCEERIEDRERPMVIEHEGVRFSCIYKGAQGDTHGNLTSSILNDCE